MRIKRRVLYTVSVLMAIALTLGATYILTLPKTEEASSRSDYQGTPEIINNHAIRLETLNEKIAALLDKYGVSEDEIGYFYVNESTSEAIELNLEQTFHGASTQKLPLAMYLYDQVNDGKLSLDDTFLYCSECYDGGVIGNSYAVGDRIPLSELLDEMIVNSDNTAIEILWRSFSSYREFRSILLETYSSYDFNSEFYVDNYTNPQYGKDVLTYLYTHRDQYEALLANMKKAAFGEYLQSTTYDVVIAHKYGSYDGYLLDYGIVYAKTPFILGVYTNNVGNAEGLIGELCTVFISYTVSEQYA